MYKYCLLLHSILGEIFLFILFLFLFLKDHFFLPVIWKWNYLWFLFYRIVVVTRLHILDWTLCTSSETVIFLISVLVVYRFSFSWNAVLRIYFIFVVVGGGTSPTLNLLTNDWCYDEPVFKYCILICNGTAHFTMIIQNKEEVSFIYIKDRRR